MYSNIYELPTQVTSSLDEEDCAKWMAVYNRLNPNNPREIKQAKREAWRACKDLPSSFSFKIKASVDAVDQDKEIIDLDSIKQHMDSYIDYGGNVQWEHGNYNVGCIWDWEPFVENGMRGMYVWGNLFGGDQVYDLMRKSFVDGKNSLSVAGEADKGRFECDERGCYTRRNVKQLLEISLCAVPANKYCRMEWYNKGASLTKSATPGFNFSVDEYEIHKTYKECPHLALKKMLKTVGYDAHARENGVFIPMSEDMFTSQAYIMKSIGLCAEPIEGGMMVSEGSYAIKKAFEELYANDAIYPDGRLDGVPPNLFNRMLANKMVTRKNGEFYLDTDRYIN